MTNHAIAPLIILATISTLTACTIKTTPPLAPNSAKTPTATATAVTLPISESHTPQMTGEVMEIHSGTIAPITMTPSVTKTKIMAYKSPAGDETIEFMVTLQDGIITSASSKTLATIGASKYNQDNFAKEIITKAVGMAKKNFKLDTVGSASLTTEAFNEYIQSL